MGLYKDVRAVDLESRGQIIHQIGRVPGEHLLQFAEDSRNNTLFPCLHHLFDLLLIDRLKLRRFGCFLFILLLSLLLASRHQQHAHLVDLYSDHALLRLQIAPVHEAEATDGTLEEPVLAQRSHAVEHSAVKLQIAQNDGVEAQVLLCKLYRLQQELGKRALKQVADEALNWVREVIAH